MLVPFCLRKKQVLLLVAAASASVMVGFSTHAALQGSLFGDVPDGGPHRTAMEWMARNEWMKADPQGHFSPDRTVDRASLVRVMVEMSGGKAGECLRTFRETQGTSAVLMQDVAPGLWYEPYVCAGLGKKIIVPDTSGNFRPAAPVAFAEAAAMIARTLSLPQKRDAAIWYKPAIDALAARRAIPDDVTSFEMPLTRAILAEIIYRLRAPDPGQPSLTYDAIAKAGAGHAGPGAEGIDELLVLINIERAKVGQAPLRANVQLQQAAQVHTDDLVAQRYFSHTSLDGRTAEARIRNAGYLTIDLATCGCTSWSYRYGEIMSDKTKTAAESVRAFLGSPLHKGIMLSPEFDEAGVGRTANTWVVDVARISRKP